MIKPETGLALASLALSLMFIFYFISLFTVFTKPLEIGTALIAEQAYQKMFIGISLFGIPNIGMSVATYLLARRNALKIVSIILMIQGLVVMSGMSGTLLISNNIMDEYRVLNLTSIPFSFIIGAFVPLGLGIRLYKLKPQPRSRFFTS